MTAAALPWLIVLTALPTGRVDTQHLEIRFEARDEVPAKALAAMADDVIDELCEDLGGCDAEILTPRLRLVASRDLQGLRRALGPGVPMWAAGIAYPPDGIAGVRMDPRRGGWAEVERTFRHEMSHLLLHRAVAGRALPRWFKEGFAMLQAKEWSFERARALSAAALTDNLLDLDDLERGFPRGRGEVTLAYAQASAVVGQMLREDSAAFVDLLRRTRQGRPFRAALEESYGAPMADIEAAWRSELDTDYALVPLLTGGGTVWVVASLIFLLGYARRRRESRRTLARWADEEARTGELDDAWG